MENATAAPIVECSNLYVGQLKYEACEDVIKNLFSDHGEVKKVTVIKYPDSGKSRGFAFVDMGNIEGAKKAIKYLNGVDFMGRNLTVSFAKENAKKKIEKVFNSEYTPGVKKIYVGNLNYNSDEVGIKGLFESVAGPVKEVSMVIDRETEKSKGFCFVEMETDDGAKSAVERLNNQMFEGRKLNVSSANDKPRQ